MMESGIAVLGSGSLGNSLVVRSPQACVLVDMGFSGAELSRRLEPLGLGVGDLDAILVTHTHTDHVGSSAISLLRREAIPLFSHAENLDALGLKFGGLNTLVSRGLATSLSGKPFEFRDMLIESFLLPHDAAGVNLGYRITMPGRAGPVPITVATDLGHFSDRLIGWFTGSGIIMLESNHDPGLLARSGRPQDLKNRISGPMGHLANSECAEALSAIMEASGEGEIRHVVLAHLSRECNTADLALDATRRALDAAPFDGISVHTSEQYLVGPVITV